VRVRNQSWGPTARDLVVLSAKPAGDLVGGQIHEGTALLRAPGTTTLTYEATVLDDEEVLGYISTSIWVYEYDAPVCCRFLSARRRLIQHGSDSDSIVEGMLDFARSWDLRRIGVGVCLAAAPCWLGLRCLRRNQERPTCEAREAASPIASHDLPRRLVRLLQTAPFVA